MVPRAYCSFVVRSLGGSDMIVRTFVLVRELTLDVGFLSLCILLVIVFGIRL